MSDWTAGYVADIGYTYGYYPELNPVRARLAFLSAGLACPEFGTACELGFGQGVSVNVHAAGSTTKWFGTDFNPSQAGFAQELARTSGASAGLYDESFAEFAARKDLPDFDFIGVHGIWSWISDENRSVIADFVRRKLRVGGVLYVSYNTLPGWSQFAPMRHLMTEHAKTMSAEGQGIVKRIDSAIEFGEKLAATNPIYCKVNTQVVGRLQKVKEMSRHYLAHEYFNRDWHPMYFSKMAEWLEDAKLNFACSASLPDHVDLVNLTSEQQKLLNEITDPLFRETVRDYILNQQFRRDYWVKGARKLSKLEREEGLAKLSVVLIAPREDIALKANGALGELTLKEAIYKPVLDTLADHQAITLGELARKVSTKGVTSGQIPEIILILAGAGHVALVQDPETVKQAAPFTTRLNDYLIEKSRSTNDVTFLASPVTGGGVVVSRFQQLLLLARKNGHKTKADWAAFAWQVLQLQGQRIVKSGATLQSNEDNLAEMNLQADVFEEKMLPLLQALGIA